MAELSCSESDSHLASVHSNEEMVFLCELTKNVDDNVWLGGVMGTFEYEWTDESEFNYSNWQSDEPSYDGEYVEM